MTREQQRQLGIAVTVAIGIVGFLQVGNADLLGLTPRALAWLGILSSGLGLLAGFLPTVRGRSMDPDDLADRIEAMTPQARRKLQARITEDHPA